MSIPKSSRTRKPGKRQRLSRILRQVFGAAGRPAGLTIRKLRVSDLPGFFKPEDEAIGTKWLGLQDRGLLYVAVAEIDGMPVGRSCLQYNALSDPPSAYMFASTVSEDWYSRGIGSALIAHNERIACSRGMYHIFSHTATNNLRAAAWRERMGYRRVREETVDWDEPDGRHIESVCWRFERTLTPSIPLRVMGSARIRLSKWRRRIVEVAGFGSRDR